ncbi:MAG: DUF2752 domain-containing protein [Rubripirellula sp.]
MDTCEHSSRDRGRLLFRGAAMLMGVLPLVLLGTARTLTPNSEGLGTHQQLGLPPCSMRVLAGIRCPGCGMTTSWAYFTRGHWLSSMQVNIGGFLLALASLYVAFLSLRSAWAGVMPSMQTQRTLTFYMVGIVVVTILEWIRRLLA